MRHYQWIDKNVGKGHELTYEGDSPNGGCFVICGFCHQKFNTNNDFGEDRDSCLWCGEDLIFPRAEW